MEKKRYLYIFSNKYQKRKLIKEELNKIFGKEKQRLINYILKHLKEMSIKQLYNIIDTINN